MAKEVVVTSAPRGIKMGRTGFQVVMRTAGMRDDLTGILERLSQYRHVHPEGGGRNPVIYSHHVLQTPVGTVSALGRVVDAGNDFSNRTNKTAHLVAVDRAEATARERSSPAAILAAIDGQLATVWTMAPGEKNGDLELPSPPVAADICRLWHQAKGDAGWAGILADRALRRQPCLLIAPDCSPEWSRKMLALFQEILSLVPTGSRWAIPFETTVLGASTALLRGTYAGSPESAAKAPGLLVVDLSAREPVPPALASCPLVTIARQGTRRTTPPLIKGTAVTSPPLFPSNVPGPAAAAQAPGTGGSGAMASPSPSTRTAPPSYPGDFHEGDQSTPSSRLSLLIVGITAATFLFLAAVGGVALVVGIPMLQRYQKTVAKNDAAPPRGGAADEEGDKNPPKDKEPMPGATDGPPIAPPAQSPTPPKSDTPSDTPTDPTPDLLVQQAITAFLDQDAVKNHRSLAPAEWPPKSAEPLRLANLPDVSRFDVAVSLGVPRGADWVPRAEPAGENGPCRKWTLKGLPGVAEAEWGEITMVVADGGTSGSMTFIWKEAPDALTEASDPRSLCRFLPIVIKLLTAEGEPSATAWLTLGGSVPLNLSNNAPEGGSMLDLLVTGTAAFAVMPPLPKGPVQWTITPADKTFTLSFDSITKNTTATLALALAPPPTRSITMSIDYPFPEPTTNWQLLEDIAIEAPTPEHPTLTLGMAQPWPDRKTRWGCLIPDHGNLDLELKWMGLQSPDKWQGLSKQRTGWILICKAILEDRLGATNPKTDKPWTINDVKKLSESWEDAEQGKTPEPKWINTIDEYSIAQWRDLLNTHRKEHFQQLEDRKSILDYLAQNNNTRTNESLPLHILMELDAMQVAKQSRGKLEQVLKDQSVARILATILKLNVTLPVTIDGKDVDIPVAAIEPFD
jgi:hypothetical protein